LPFTSILLSTVLNEEQKNCANLFVCCLTVGAGSLAAESVTQKSQFCPNMRHTEMLLMTEQKRI